MLPLVNPRRALYPITGLSFVLLDLDIIELTAEFQQVLQIFPGRGLGGLSHLKDQAHRHAAASIRKKITVVEGVATSLGLQNLTPCCARVETLPGRFDYVVSRAVTAMPEFVKWIWDKIERGQRGSLPNGILYLKGGDLAEELGLTGRRWYLYDIPRFFSEEFFETKKVVYTPKK